MALVPKIWSKVIYYAAFTLYKKYISNLEIAQSMWEEVQRLRSVPGEKKIKALQVLVLEFL